MSGWREFAGRGMHKMRGVRVTIKCIDSCPSRRTLRLRVSVRLSNQMMVLTIAGRLLSSLALACATSLRSHPSRALPLSLLPIGRGSSGRVKTRGPVGFTTARVALTLSFAPGSPGREKSRARPESAPTVSWFGLGVLDFGALSESASRTAPDQPGSEPPPNVVGR